MDDYKEESKAVDEALTKMMTEKGEEAIKEFQEKLQTFGEKFDKARKTEVAACFCGEPIDDPTEQEVSPSMYYFNRRTCSTICHNKWILGQFDEDGSGRPVGKGWVPIIEQLDKDISALDPDYQIMQVKEKFGTLRFYCDYDEPELPLGITGEEVWALGSIKSDLYTDIQKAENPDDWYGENDIRPEPIEDWKLQRMKQNHTHLKNLVNKLRPIDALINKAEEESERTCEWCGEPGTLDNTQGWLLSLCDGCKQKRAEGKRG